MYNRNICQSCGKPLDWWDIKKGHYHHEQCFFKYVTITKNENGSTMVTIAHPHDKETRK